MATLPTDVLDMICWELGKLRSFGTLLNCALANRSLAGSAVLYLYRYRNQTGVHDEGDARGHAVTQKHTWEEGNALAVAYSKRWALMWRSIIRSSLGSTAYPYCLYIRSLDLQNFYELLGDVPFQNAVQDSFFDGDMAQFLHAQETPTKKRTRSGKALPRRFDVKKIVDLVGESITSFVSYSANRNKSTVALEDIAVSTNQISLPLWVSRLPRLRSMKLFKGDTLNESLANSINNNCPYFEVLAFFRGGTDKNLAEFFGGLKANTIKSFTTFHAQNIGESTLHSLNNHSISLTSLKLDGLVTDAIKNLSSLQGCVAIEALELTAIDTRIDLEGTENDVFEDIVSWLVSCVNLREILFNKFFSGPAILTRLCVSQNTHLRHLEVRDYSLLTASQLHGALSQQTMLEFLTLRADNEDSSREDIDHLLASITQLKNLKELDLLETSEELFNNTDIKFLASSLPKLEVLYVSGLEITDQIWSSIGDLHYLRSLNITALSSFTANGILNYIWQLKPTNRGLALWIGAQMGEYDFDDDKKNLIRDSLLEKVGGRFDFILHRENESEFDSDSD